MSDRARPILFSGPMVRAILAGKKTQTRRPVYMRHVGFIGGSGMQDDPSCWGFGDEDGCWHVLDQSCPAWYGADFGVTSESYRITSPFGSAGDRLWVRETWCQRSEGGDLVYTPEGNLDPSCCWYAADSWDVRALDGDGFTRLRKDGTEASPWRPSIHMPRWASRLTLEVTGVRVERLHEISEADAMAEGVDYVAPGEDPIEGGGYAFFDGACIGASSARDAFGTGWDHVYGKRQGRAWADNPWVWVVDFRRIEA